MSFSAFASRGTLLKSALESFVWGIFFVVGKKDLRKAIGSMGPIQNPRMLLG